MTDLDIDAAKKQALEEIQQEEYRAAVDKFKRKFREHRSLWDRLIPFRIIIVKKGDTL